MQSSSEGLKKNFRFSHLISIKPRSQRLHRAFFEIHPGDRNILDRQCQLENKKEKKDTPTGITVSVKHQSKFLSSPPIVKPIFLFPGYNQTLSCSQS